MIKIENLEVAGIEHAIRGMRNPMNSWEKSDSRFIDYYNDETETIECHNILKDNLYFPYGDNYGNNFESIGPNDMKLMKSLVNAGSEHSKFRRMIVVYADILAPLYWWKEFDTYKVGTVANSCSTMHKIAEKPFEFSDFSVEHLMGEDNNENYMLRAQIKDHFYDDNVCFPLDLMSVTIGMLNQCRTAYRVTEDPAKKKEYWWQMIQLLPSSYNQKRTVMLNYENLAAIYRQRKDHKLNEWHTFCDWIKELPYAKEVITLED